MNESTDLIEQYLTWLEHNRGRSAATVTKYRGYLQRLDIYLVKQEGSLLTATTEQLEAFAGIHAHQLGLTPRSRRPLVASVRQFYAWLFKRGSISMDPASEIPYPNAGLKLPTPMELHNAEKLLMQPDISTFIGLRDTAMLFILVGCGVRVSGLVGLNEESLSFVQWNNREWLVFKVQEKGKKERLVPAPHECYVLVRAYLEHSELAGIDRRLPNGDQVLFVSTMNRSISPAEYHGEKRRIATRSVHDMITRYADSADIPRHQAHAHAMRHLYGAHMTEFDVSTLILQSLMGHEDPKTTEIYTKLAVRKLTEVVSKNNPLRHIRTPITDLVRELERNGA